MSTPEMAKLYKKIERLMKDPELGDIAESLMVLNRSLMEHSTRFTAYEKRIAALEKQVALLKQTRHR